MLRVPELTRRGSRPAKEPQPVPRPLIALALVVACGGAATSDTTRRAISPAGLPLERDAQALRFPDGGSPVTPTRHLGRVAPDAPGESPGPATRPRRRRLEAPPASRSPHTRRAFLIHGSTRGCA